MPRFELVLLDIHLATMRINYSPPKSLKPQITASKSSLFPTIKGAPQPFRSHLAAK